VPNIRALFFEDDERTFSSSAQTPTMNFALGLLVERDKLGCYLFVGVAEGVDRADEGPPLA
jgi:hypothetical protein